MGFLYKLLLIGSALSAVYISQLFLKNPPIPQFKDQWWGEGQPRVQDESIKPFKIKVSDEVCHATVTLKHLNCMYNLQIGKFRSCLIYMTD
jgi:hypothetical protein